MSNADVLRAVSEAEEIPCDILGWPKPPQEDAYYGLAGDFVRAIEPHTEADPVAILVQFLAAFGNAAGSSPHFVAEADRHSLNLYTILVGETAKARKGVSWGHASRPLLQADSTWESRIASGLASGEGVISNVRDAAGNDPGEKDKRLCLYEPEFAQVLKVLKRNGNTLSPVLRNAWDGRSLATLTKHSPLRATGAHISIIGHITRSDLLVNLDDVEVTNGFGNRFIWFCVRRSKCLPEGGSVNAEELEALVVRVQEALDFARKAGVLRRDEGAREIWNRVYRDLSEGKPGLVGAMTARSEPQVMRLASTYAVLDRSESIRREHLLAAIALWEYSEASVRFIFGDRSGDSVADRIFACLREQPEGMTRTEISGHLARNVTKARIDQALDFLRRCGLVQASGNIDPT